MFTVKTIQSKIMTCPNVILEINLLKLAHYAQKQDVKQCVVFLH